jgi:hypothetical protein
LVVGKSCGENVKLRDSNTKPMKARKSFMLK